MTGLAAGGERLCKYLAGAGVAARRQAEVRFIAPGRVAVNGEVVRDPARRVLAGDVVSVDGRPVQPEAKASWVLHKPAGVLSAASDPRGRPTVVALVPEPSLRLYPVGRLDTDSEGLLLVTNDGALTQALLHPRRRVRRVYCALVRPEPRAADLLRLEQGVRLSDGPARAEDVARLPAPPPGLGQPGEEGTWITLVLREGRNREARRLCAAVGLDVLRLVRTAMGSLTLDRLPAGQARPLLAQEAAALWRCAGLAPPRA